MMLFIHFEPKPTGTFTHFLSYFRAMILGGFEVCVVWKGLAWVERFECSKFNFPSFQHLESPSKLEYEFVTLGFGGIVAGNEFPSKHPSSSLWSVLGRLYKLGEIYSSLISVIRLEKRVGLKETQSLGGFLDNEGIAFLCGLAEHQIKSCVLCGCVFSCSRASSCCLVENFPDLLAWVTLSAEN